MKKLSLTILKTFGFFMAWALGQLLVPESLYPEDPAMLRLALEWPPLVLVLLLTFLFTFFVEKRKVGVPFFGRFLQNLFIGLVTGALWITGVAAVMSASGAYTVTAVNAMSRPWIWVLSAVINVCMQELLIRGYLYSLWKERYNRLTAAFVTTAIFVALHVGAFEAGIVAVLNVLTMSLFMSALLEYTGTLLAPVLAHAIWNVTGALVLGGVSLAGDYPQLLGAVFSGDPLFSGGEYGFEGSAVTLIANSLLFTLFLILLRARERAASRRNPAQGTGWKAPEPAALHG